MQQFQCGLSSFDDLEALRNSATRKTGRCQTCRILWHCLQQCIPDHLQKDSKFGIDDEDSRLFLDQEVDGELIPRKYFGMPNKSLSVWVTKRGTASDTKTIEIYTLPNTPGPWSLIGPAHHLSQTTSSSSSLSCAKNWLMDCIKSHKRCNPPKKHLPLPKRLIDVINYDIEGPVKLIETSGEEGHYLCLSHCWGHPEHHLRPLETTQENFERHKAGISWKNLPKTFQDAVSFVRRLGKTPHIWIDSLCIIQGCADDWAQESAKMADIYYNSFLTLAATSSTNSAGGLFSAPDDQYKAHPFKVKDQNGSSFTIYCRKTQPHWYSRLSLDHIRNSDTISRAPLLQRAWAYQERILSPRMLHFGYQELLWECREAASCECNLHGSLDDDCPRFDPFPGTDYDPLECLDLRWNHSLRQYMRLDLTKASDRLPAMAGIAKQMQNLRGGQKYFAGLWNDTFLSDLLWHVDIKGHLWSSGYTADTTRDTSLAPSWSWACIHKADIETSLRHGDRLTRMVFLMDVRIEPESDQNFVKVLSGSITLRGFLFFAELSSPDLITYKVELHWSFYEPRNIPCDHSCMDHSEMGFCSECPNAGNLVAPPNMTCLFLDYRIPRSELSNSSSFRFYCLLMERSPPEHPSDEFLLLRRKIERSVYERVGLVRILRPHPYPLRQDNLQAVVIA
ncbi:heterokaryon incompatibility protein-domain-containing protein [Phyllosticta capitalensis]